MLNTIRQIRKDVDKMLEPYKPKIKYFSYMGSSILCEISCSVAVQKGFRSKIPLNKAKYIGTAVAMHLASNACQREANRK